MLFNGQFLHGSHSTKTSAVLPQAEFLLHHSCRRSNATKLTQKLACFLSKWLVRMQCHDFYSCCDASCV